MLYISVFLLLYSISASGPSEWCIVQPILYFTNFLVLDSVITLSTTQVSAIVITCRVPVSLYSFIALSKLKVSPDKPKTHISTRIIFLPRCPNSLYGNRQYSTATNDNAAKKSIIVVPIVSGSIAANTRLRCASRPVLCCSMTL